jgi:hypothetical protein
MSTTTTAKSTIANQTGLDAAAMEALEAAAFRRLVAHLRDNEVQNIDLMNLAGFCRNCLSNWLEDAAGVQGQPLDRATARAHVYGMPYEDWKALNQKQADAAQQAAFAARMAEGH